MEKSLIKILENVGDAVIVERLNYGSRLVKLINRFIADKPADDSTWSPASVTLNGGKLTNLSTGKDALLCIRALDNKSLIELLTINLNVELGIDNVWLEVQSSLNAADDKGKNTRPITAIIMAVTVAVFVCCYSTSLIIVAINNGTLPGWMELTAAVGVPSLVLTAYFNKRTLDKSNRINASLGMPAKPTLIDTIAKNIGLTT